ncbi:hypothetical protein ACFX2I_041511 [Malus domestica]|uniref:Uncharacterized protein n=1 Tax=Malus domestica TaxID=3750 RepID=A0A498JGG5_MALDO|nr:hypothetical protein DVH24_024314 [Malus domestica]
MDLSGSWSSTKWSAYDEVEVKSAWELRMVQTALSSWMVKGSRRWWGVSKLWSLRRRVGIRGLDWMRFLEEHQVEFVVQSRMSKTYERRVREVGPNEEED